MSFDGRLTGRSCGNRNAASSVFSAILSAKMPASAARRLRCCASAFLSGGRVCSTCASAASCAKNVELGDLPGLALLAQQIEHVALDLDDLVRRLDLAPQRGLLDRGAGQVRRQRQIGRFQLEALGIGLRLKVSIAHRVAPKTSGV